MSGRVEQRLAEVVGEARSPLVNRLTTAGAVQELLGGLAFRELTSSEQTALVDSLGQLNETVFRDVAQAGEFRAWTRAFGPGRPSPGDAATRAAPRPRGSR